MGKGIVELDERAISALKILEKAGYKPNKLISELITEASPFLIQRINDKSKKTPIQYIYEWKRA
jgi:hypothetical protein